MGAAVSGSRVPGYKTGAGKKPRSTRFFKIRGSPAEKEVPRTLRMPGRGSNVDAGRRLLERLGLPEAVCAVPPERHGPYTRLRLTGGLDVWCRAWGARWAVVVRHGEQGVKHVYPDLDTATHNLPARAAASLIA